MMSLLGQGLIWRAACPACVLVAIVLEPHPLRPDETAFLDWLATRGIETVIVGEHELRGPSRGSSAPWAARSGLDKERTALAKGLEDLVGALREPTPSRLRADVSAYLKGKGWVREALPEGRRPLFGYPSAKPKGIFRGRSGKLLCIETPIVRHNDAGGAGDGRFQMGMALSHVVDGTIVVALDQKQRGAGTDIERASGQHPEFVRELSSFCRELGIDWRLVRPGGRSEPIRWPAGSV
jgi:hypothetical protein